MSQDPSVSEMGLPKGCAGLQAPQAGSLQFVTPLPLGAWALRAPGQWKGLVPTTVPGLP